MNFDQTTLKYALAAKQTLSKKGSKQGLLFRQSMTATFGINFANNFLLMQFVFGGKTENSLHCVKFPDSFSLNINESTSSKFAQNFRFLSSSVLLVPSCSFYMYPPQRTFTLVSYTPLSRKVPRRS